MNILRVIFMISMAFPCYLRSEEIDPFSDAPRLESIKPLTIEEISKIAKNIANSATQDIKSAWEINVDKDTITFISRKNVIHNETRTLCRLRFVMKLINQVSDEEILKRVQIKNEKTLKLKFGVKDKDEWVRISDELSKLDVPVYSYPFANILICVKKGIIGDISSVNVSPLFNDIEKFISKSNINLFELPLGVTAM